MASYVTPVKNSAFIMYIGLPSQANPNTFQNPPTLAAGDVKVSTDGGALANITTPAAVTPGSSKMVKLSLSATEMNGDNITVVCSDVSGAEWRDVIINIQTSARQIDDIPTAAVIADAVWDEPLTQPAAVFAWAGSFRNLVNWLGALGRNKILETNSLSTLRNDADSVDVATSTVSDDGTTFTRNKWT